MADNLYYDDRLATAISGPVPEASLAAVQYRQIIDLLADAAPANDEAEATQLRQRHKGRYFSETDFAAALVRLNALAGKMSPSAQASALGESARPLKSTPLVRFLLAQPEAVRDATMSKTRLSAAQWLEVLQTMSPEQRAWLDSHAGFGDSAGRDDEADIRTGNDSDEAPFIALPRKDDASQALIDDSVAPAPAATADIGGIVERIAHFTAQRDAGAAPHLPLEEFETPALAVVSEICFISDAGGLVTSTDPDMEAIGCGLPLFIEAEDSGCGCNTDTAALARQYRPIVGGRYNHRGAPALAGAWRIDAWPRFADTDQHFIGYCGLLTRLDTADSPVEPGQDGPEVADDASEATALAEQDYRQLAHELRTPAGALKGFAEILQSQLFGPVAAPYRDMAQAIIEDTDLVLEGLDGLQAAPADQAEL
ncbi:MAG: hypothetical protein AAFX04_06450 [Pseudomonadota bacterium]